MCIRDRDSGAGKEKSYGLLTVAADAKCASREDTQVGQKKDHTLRQDRTVRMVFETVEKILKADGIASGGIKSCLLYTSPLYAGYDGKLLPEDHWGDMITLLQNKGITCERISFML